VRRADSRAEGLPESPMPLEVEIKLAVESHDPIIRALRENGGSRTARYFELNRMFDLPDGVLRAARRGLRIRQFLPHNGCVVPAAVMTYKDSPIEAKLKTREEIEFEVSDADAAAAMLASLGYIVTLQFEKKRERWKLGSCAVDLDEIPRLGLFVEVEGPDGDTVEHTAKTLGLDVSRAVRGSYVRLLAEDAERRGESGSVFRFTAE